MPEFNIEDTEGIKDYVKSLDIYNQFDEIIVDQITHFTADRSVPIEVEIKIFANDRLFYTRTERRLFTEPIVQFNRYFEKDVKDLSNVLVLGRSIIAEVDELKDFMIIMNEFSSNLVIVSTSDSQYTLHLSKNYDEFSVSSVVAKYEIDCGDFKSSHEFKTKHAVELEELKSVVEKFKSLREQIVQSISI